MKTKICLISPKFLDYIGGMETHAYEFAKWFSNKPDYKLVSVITRKETNDGIYVAGSTDKYIKTKIIKELTTDFKKDLNIILKNSPKDTKIYFFNSPNWIPLIKSLKEIRGNSKVIIRSGGTDLVAGWIGSEDDLDGHMEENKKFIVSIINNYVDMLVVNSNFSKQRFLDIGIKGNKMLVVSGGVDCKRYNPLLRERKDNKIIILHASRFVKCKGIQNILKVFKIVISKFKGDIKLILVGDGPEKLYLEKKAKELFIMDKVIFTGAQTIEDMPNYFNNADIFLHLPITLIRKERGGQFKHVESMGRVFCEASAAGLPSVSFAIGGVPEIIIGKKTGFLLEEGDIKSVANKLVLLIKNKKLRLSMGKESRKMALKYFDWEKIFKIYGELFINEK